MLTVISSAGEPISLADMKKHLRVDWTEDDDVITSLIPVARQRVEKAVDQAIVSQVVQETFESWPEPLSDPNARGNFHGHYLPDTDLPGTQAALNLIYYNDLFVTRVPLVSVDWIKYLPYGGGAQITVDPSAYYVIPGPEGRIELAPNASWPSLAQHEEAIVVQYTAAATNVEQPLLHAMKLLVGHYFQNREAGTPAPSSPLPLGVEYLLAPYRSLGI